MSTVKSTPICDRRWLSRPYAEPAARRAPGRSQVGEVADNVGSDQRAERAKAAGTRTACEGDPSEPAYEPLKTLLALERPVSGAKGADLVIWIDDAQLHLQRGLTRDNLRRLAELYPEAVVALTIHSNALDGVKDFDAPLHQLLRKPFDSLLLLPKLNGPRTSRRRGQVPRSGRQFRPGSTS